MMNTEIETFQSGVINPEKYFSYELGKSVKVQEMKPSQSLSDIMVNETNRKPLKTMLLTIFAKYLAINIKSRAISNDFAYKLLIDYFLDECRNLELQEIEYIFKNGVMGKFGEIYNDISIDTICGKTGWVETYYKEHRSKRIEPTFEESLNFNGKEMTLQEFHELHPVYKEKSIILDIVAKARVGQCTIKELKDFYKMKGFSIGEMQDDISAVSAQYYNSQYCNQITESQYINHWINNFIVNNFNKSKS